MYMDTPSQQAVPIQVLSDRAELIKRASLRLPLTAEGLPVGFYRADLLPVESQAQAQYTGSDTDSDTDSETLTNEGNLPIDEISRQQALQAQALQEAQALQAAYVDLSYEHGYPTLQSGEPFWHKLDFEPGLAYGAFQIYLELQENGPRELTQLADHPELKAIYSRYLNRDATRSDMLLVLNEYFVLYYWRHRSRAYDLFKEAAYRHTRMRRAIKTEDYHYNLAERLLKRIEGLLASDDYFEQLEPREAIAALAKLVAIQRVSAGLPASGPLSAKESPESQSFEMILRQLTSRQASQLPSRGQVVGQTPGILNDVLRDPSTATMMQELIIKVTSRSQAEQNPIMYDAPSEGNVIDGQAHRDNGNGNGNSGLDDLSFHKNDI